MMYSYLLEILVQYLFPKTLVIGQKIHLLGWFVFGPIEVLQTDSYKGHAVTTPTTWCQPELVVFLREYFHPQDCTKKRCQKTLE